MIKGIRGIHHLAVSVPDLEEAQRFYCDVLGMRLAERYDFEASERGDAVLDLTGAAARSFMLEAGNVFLEVFEFSHPEPKEQPADRPVNDHGYTHLAFDVDDIETVYRQLESGGVAWHCEIQEYQDEHDWFRNAYGRDPFGNVIEIQQILVPSTWDVGQLPLWGKS